MCNHLVQHLFDCELCMSPVSSDEVGYDVENNLCPFCKDETDYEAMAQYLPFRFMNAGGKP